MNLLFNILIYLFYALVLLKVKQQQTYINMQFSLDDVALPIICEFMVQKENNI